MYVGLKKKLRRNVNLVVWCFSVFPALCKPSFAGRGFFFLLFRLNKMKNIDPGYINFAICLNMSTRMAYLPVVTPILKHTSPHRPALTALSCCFMAYVQMQAAFLLLPAISKVSKQQISRTIPRQIILAFDISR